MNTGISVTEFREILEKDKTFTDYLDAFLNLPVSSFMTTIICMQFASQWQTDTLSDLELFL